MKERILSVFIAAAILVSITSVMPLTVSASEPKLVSVPTAPAVSNLFITSRNITLTTDTKGAEIFYTLDGSEPATTSSLYTEPFAITETATVKAIAYKDGVSSGVMTAAFTQVVIDAAARSKIDTKTIDAIEKAGEDDLIKIWLFRPGIRPHVIDAILAEEFDGKTPGNSGSSGSNDFTHEDARAYNDARRAIVVRLYTESNTAFKEAHIPESRKISYEGYFTSTFILEATPAEIMMYASLSDVTIIGFYDENIQSGGGGGPSSGGGSGNTNTETQQTFTVTFNLSGGTSAAIPNRTTGTNGRITFPASPKMDGYTFSGWFTAAKGGTQVKEDKVYTANTTLFAQWKEDKPQSQPQPKPPHKFTTGDALNILRYVAGAGKLTNDQKKLYDFNGSGKITTSDALHVLRKVAGIL
jgi:uncharacterized repeat protein (TIGR02543 family)